MEKENINMFAYGDEEAKMAIEIPREKWGQFFKDLSKRRFAWETKIEILDDSDGLQVLANGLHLSGVDFEEKAGKSEIEVSVGEFKEQHLTHTISNPDTVTLYPEIRYHDGIVEIADKRGIKTRIRIFNPVPIMAGYAAYHQVLPPNEPVF